MRWEQHLSSGISSEDWTFDESKKLMVAYHKHGTCWKKIMANFPKRCVRFVKNQFLTIVRGFLIKFFRPLKSEIKAKEINKMRPKVLANYLHHRLKLSSFSPNSNESTILVYDLLDKTLQEDQSFEKTESVTQEHHTNLEAALKDLRNMK